MLLTGSTDGMGLHIARQLVTSGRCSRLLLHGRSDIKGAAVLRELSSASEQASRQCHVTFHNADLGDLDSIRAMFEEIGHCIEKLDCLINNAGVALKTGPQRSVQGFELTHAINLYAPYLLTELCEPLLTAARGTVVHVSSAACEAQILVDPHWPADSNYDPFTAYASSKYALALLGVRQAARWADVVMVNSVNPLSNMATPMVYGVYGDALPDPLTNPADGASYVLDVALGTDYKHVSGKYFDGDRKAAGDEWCLEVPNFCSKEAARIEQSIRVGLNLD